MKKIITLLFIASLGFGAMNAQNLLDTDWAGYEISSNKASKAFAEGYWYGNNVGNAVGDTLFSRTEEMAYSGSASMRFSSLNGVPAGDVKLQGSNFPYGVDKLDSLPPGDYMVSYMLYLDTDNTMSEIKTTISKPWTIMLWDISETPRGEWVKMSAIVNFADSLGSSYNFQLPTLTNSSASGKQVLYVDDNSFYLLGNITEYKAGNALNKNFYGFEKSYLDADGWYPQNNAGAGYFDFVYDKSATDLYSMKFSYPTDSLTVAPDVLKVQAVAGDGNTIALTGAIYDMYIKVWINDNSEISEFNTNFAADETGAFTPVIWDLSDVTKGEWVEIHQEVTLPTYTSSKFTFQLAKTNVNVTLNDATMYIDDIALVYNRDDVATTLQQSQQLQSKIYPNPTSGMVNISAEEGSRINIYAISGKLVKSINDVASLTSFSTSDFTKGIYLVSIENASGKTIEKLQVK